MSKFTDFLAEAVEADEINAETAGKTVQDAFDKHFSKSYLWSRGQPGFLNFSIFLVTPKKEADNNSTTFDPVNVTFKLDFNTKSVEIRNKRIYVNAPEGKNAQYGRSTVSLRSFNFKDLKDLSKKADKLFNTVHTTVKNEFDSGNMSVFDGKYDIKSKL